MPAQRYDFEIEQGASFALTWPVLQNGEPMDLTGYTVRSQIRKQHGDSVVLHEFSNAEGNAVADNRGITLSVKPTESSAWTWTHGVYDVELVHPGGTTVVRVAEGRVTVSPEVTR